MCQLVLAAAQFLFWHFNDYEFTLGMSITMDLVLACLSLWI
jgi:hypothetical protein